MAGMKGRFIPKNPGKYLGNPNTIMFRSAWELRVMQFFDQNKNLMLEAYEYKNYLKDKQAHFKSYRIAVQKMKIQRKYRKQQQGRSL